MCLFVGVPSYTQVVMAQVYNVVTVAGSTQGYADGVGVNAKFNSPTGIAIDNNGNIYVGDWLNNYVRKISPSSIVTTLAGNGVPGYQNGTGIGAQFQYPNGVAVDAEGTVYVADRLNHRIRKITSSGVVTTLAGSGVAGFADGNGLNAKFYRPSDVTVDGNCIVYVADDYNHCIRKITPSGDVTTIAGNGTAGFADGIGAVARFNDPVNIAVDGNGNLYVTDYNNHRIRKITPTGFVTTIAGSGTPGYQDGISTTAKFYLPTGLDVDYVGNVYVADRGNNRIRKITTTGVVTTIAGLGQGYLDGTNVAAQFNQPYSVSVDNAGNIYVVDTGNNRIRKIIPVSPSAVFEGTTFSEDAANNGSVPTTYNVTLINTAWSNTIPNGATLTQGIHFSAANVPAGLTAVVTKVNASQATISFRGNAVQHTAQASVNNVQLTFTDAALNGVVASGVQGLNGVNLSIVFTGQDCNTVTTFAGNGTIASVDGVGTAASFIDPIAVTTDKSGNVYVTDGTKIRKITPAGVVSTFAGAGGGLGAMNGIAIDGNGNLFAIEQTLIRKVTPAGAVSTVPIIGATISNGSDIAVDAFGNLYISDGIASIYKIAPNGVAKRLNNQNVIASGIAVDAVGNVYCGGYNTHKVFKVAVNGTVTTVAGSGIAGYADGTGTAAQFNEPVGVTLDASGNLYVMDYVGSRIRKIAPGGVVSTIAGSGNVGYADGVGTSAQFNYPLHLALDTTGNLFVTDRLNYRIRSINVCGASGALPGAAAYSGTVFMEAVANNGSISTTQTITLGRASWSEGIANGGTLIAGTHFTARNVPAGLTAVVTKISASQATMSFSGTAAQHTSAFNINNVQLTFTDAALNNASASSVQGLNGVNLSIAFRNLGTAVYSGTVFPEAAANTGTVTTARTITLTDEQWTSAVGVNSTFVAGSHYIALGVPAGLQLRLTKTSATVATLSFTGTALAHQNANDSTITLTFLPQALASLTPTEQIAGLNRTITVDFQDNPSAFYSGTSFVESAVNNGTVSTTRTITLAFDTFVPTGAFTPGVHFIATGVPAGLTLSVTRTSQTVAQLAFTGSAAAHESLNDATIGLSFSNAAVVSGNAAAVVGLTPKTLTIDFADAPQSGVAVYSDSTFVESANNNGSVNTVRTLTLNGDSFVGVNNLVLGIHFTATGVPAGLTLNLRRTSPTVVELSLSGAALAHNNANDAVVTLTFLNAALVSGNATGIIGLTAKRLFVDFADPTCGAVTTFAGNGNAAVVDGAGVLASFADPRDIATDAAGNVYVADKTCVRKITPSGIVSILAGSATASGYVNGTGVNARFGDVWGLALDASGNVYVADERNAAIRMITPSGTVSTVAGGNGSGNKNGAVATATFFSPQDVAVDAFGNLYIADFGNNAIRKISGGIVSTLNTSPITNGPVSLVVDVAGYIYVAAYNSNKIYKVTPSGSTSVIAGSGALGNRNDIGVAASFGQPSGIAIDGTGNLYVCDYYPYGLIRKITPSGAVSTIAGTGAFGYADGIGTNAAFNYPWGLALDASGNLFIADRFNQRIRSVYVCGASGQFPLVATYSGTVFPEAVANKGTITTTQTITLAGTTWSSAVPDGGTFTPGTHYNTTAIPDGMTFSIVRDSPTKAQLVFSGSAAAHANINDTSFVLTFLNAALANGSVSAVTGLTPKTLMIDFNDPVISPPEVVAAVGYAPYHIARDAAGNFFVPQQGTHKVYKVLPQSNGTVQVITGFTSTALLTGGIAIDSSGNIFVATLANTIEKLAPGASVSTTFHASSALSTPFGLDVDKSGNLYVASFDNASIVKITPTGQASVLYQGSPLVHPMHAILDSDGHLVVADFGTSTSGIGTGNLFKIFFCNVAPPRLIAQNLNVPNGLTRTKSGRIFITNAAPGAGLLQYAEPQVLAATSGLGQLQTYPVAGTLSEPVHIGVDQQGDMYITENVGRISRIRTTGELPITLGASAQAAVGTLSATQFTFPEAAVNNGTITKKDTLGMSCGTFSNVDTLRLGIDYLVSNVPPGLTLVLKRIAQDKLQMNFVGAALAHQSVNNATAVLQFLNPAISSGNGAQLPSVQLAITFLNNPPPTTTTTATYSDSVFTETAANAGQVTTTRTVTLSGASFVTGAYTNGTHFTATGVPAGLTLTVTRLSATQARIAFSGTASDHALANSTNVGLTFLPAVLTGGNVAGVVGLTPKTLRVNFLDPYTASYSDTTFAESIANDGTVPTTRTVTLVGVNFTTTATTLMQGTHFNVSGVPAGLTLTVTKTSSNVAQIAFSGAAAAHVIDVNNITLSFLNAALESGSGTAVAVTGLTPKKLSIDFIAPYTATYSAKNFVEGPANDGTVPTVRTLTLFGGDSFLPATLLQGAHFTATGVPAGLTMVMTRTSSTTAHISFNGTATNHANVNDASVSVTFTPEALASGNPSAVVGLTPAMLTIDFRDPDVTPPSSPNILGFTPQVGTTGTVVTISGFGFTGTQNVLFGGAPAKSFTIHSDSTIAAVVDYGSTGDVTVVNAQGFAILPGFTYVPRPVISSFTPTTGNAGAVVTITGSNFQGTALNGTSWTTTSVYFGGTPATSFTVLSPTQIQATVGVGATGAVRVETLPGNVGVRNGFCYMAPLITAFAPTSASTGTQVVITGSNFTGATAVKFNGKAAASFAVVSDTQITAFPATGTPLTGSISVTTPQCTDDLATFTFIPAPIIYGFWLSGGTDGDVITIDGINFTGASGVKFGDMIAASYTVVSPTRIQAVVGSGNTGAVTVIGPGGVGSRSKFIYYAPGAGRPNPPIITSFTPTEGPDGTVVTINGLNFQGADWYTTAVRIGDAPDGPKTAIIQSMTATKLVVKVNGGATGLIRVYTPAGVTTSTQTFTYFPPPTISAFTPTTGGAGTTVTILGTEFTGVTSVKFGGVSATSFTVDSPTQITATVGAGNTGRVQVVASGGTATSSVNFTLPTPPPAPTVTTFSPAIATTGTVITINGSNFTGATQVTFGGTPAQSFTVVNASRITAVVGGGASGSVAVTTPSGSASKTGFTYLPKPLPTITSFAPASASPGQTVTILGTYFTGATQVFMGSASVPFTVIHSGKITVEVPTNAASGVIRVVTPDGVALRSGFTFIPLVAMLDNFGGAHLTTAPPSEPLILAGRSETAESVSLGVYPNPATDVVTLTATGFGDGRVVNVTLLNALGQTILTLNKESIGGNLQTRLDVREVASGAYTAVLSDGAVRHVVRFVKR